MKTKDSAVSLAEIIIGILLFLLNPYLFIPVLIYYIKIKRYKKSSYYNITKTKYHIMRGDKGSYGEYLTYNKLKDFETDGAKFLFNIYLPLPNDEFSEIDVLMISRKGIFVFESKNYSGWIFGDESKRYWYQTLANGKKGIRKESFYNPIWQNRTHIKYIKKIFGDDMPVWSVIVFSDRCKLKNIEVYSDDVSVINRYDVYDVIDDIYKEIDIDLLDEIDVINIYNTLYPFTQNNEVNKESHISNLRKFN